MKEQSNAVMSMRDVQVLLTQQMNTLRVQRKMPSQEAIKAANAQANLVGKYLGTVKLTIEYAKMVGLKPDLAFLKLANGKAATPQLPQT